MRKVIGIVGEGPIDQMVLKAAINRICWANLAMAGRAFIDGVKQTQN